MRSPTDTRAAARLLVTGRVQGIGMRPAIARLAQQFSLTGFVANNERGVEIHLQGQPADLESFRRRLPDSLPPGGEIESIEWRDVPIDDHLSFVVHSDPESHPSRPGSGQLDLPLAAQVPLDRMICEACRLEVKDPANRRFSYALTCCTDCGPRYSIIRDMPFERHGTTMTAFPLCENCRTEQMSSGDRRFHCQTNACPDCGPAIWLRNAKDETLARDDSAIRHAMELLLAGRILAVRGLGGYQLLADATSEATVAELRHRKNRKRKPLAVMVDSLEEAARIAMLTDVEASILTDPAGPIVILQRRPATGLADALFGGLNTVGLMLPTTPLHCRLSQATGRPLVCTSANPNGQPLVYRQEHALSALAGLADAWLEHDRDIIRPIDDSVVRVIAGQPATIRLGRGLAPLKLPLETPHGLTAYGGHQKSSIAVSNGHQAILGPHVGDLDTLPCRDRFHEQIEAIESLYRARPTELVSDLHPEYFTTRQAESRGRDRGLPLTHVQHHHAHVVAGMLDNGWLNRQVLGVAFDGTGWGPDGTIWGGEFLLATARNFQRVGSLRALAIAGGEAALRQPWRIAVSMIREAAPEDEDAIQVLQSATVSRRQLRQLADVIRRPKLTWTTTSVGRLFDAAAALILGIEQCDDEGEAAMLLEAACDREETGVYSFPVRESERLEIDWRPAIRQIMADRGHHVDPGSMAMRFHRGLAEAVVTICRRFPELPVVLGGGVFQNRMLVELIAESPRRGEQPLGLPGRIPVNDGGLAAGQLAIAACRGNRK